MTIGREHDLATVRCEAHGVAQQVGEHLLQALTVGLHRREMVVDMPHEAQHGVFHHRLKHVGRFLHQLRQ